MPIPKPNKLETESAFMSRCVSFLLDEGTPQEQAVAICTSQYRDEKLKTMAWKTIDRKRASYIKHAKTQFSRALKAQANEYLRQVKDNGLSDEYTISSEPLQKAMRNVYKRVMTQFARDTYNDLIEEAKKTQTNWQATVDRWFDGNVIDLSDLMTDTTARSVRDIARDAIVEGKSIREFQNDLMASYSVSERRAELIGRTEIIRASNAGSLLGAQETGFPMKKYWLATRDNRTRGLNPKDIYDHYSMDENNGIPLDQAFNVSGEQLQHPGDRAGSPGNTINCRCTLTYEVIETPEGQIIEETIQPTNFANKEGLEKEWHEVAGWEKDPQVLRIVNANNKEVRLTVKAEKDRAQFVGLFKEIDMDGYKIDSFAGKVTFRHEYGHAIDDFMNLNSISGRYNVNSKVSRVSRRVNGKGLSNLAVEDIADDASDLIKRERLFREKFNLDYVNDLFETSQNGYGYIAGRMKNYTRGSDAIDYFKKANMYKKYSPDEILDFIGMDRDFYQRILSSVGTTEARNEINDELLKMLFRIGDGLEFGAFKDFKKQTFLRFFQKIPNDLFDEARDRIDEFGAMMDTIGSGTDLLFGFGHSRSYYDEGFEKFLFQKSGVKVGYHNHSEMFAQFITLRSSSKRKLYDKIYRDLFPKTHTKFTNIIDYLDKNGYNEFLETMTLRYSDETQEAFDQFFKGLAEYIDYNEIRDKETYMSILNAIKPVNESYSNLFATISTKNVALLRDKAFIDRYINYLDLVTGANPIFDIFLQTQISKVAYRRIMGAMKQAIDLNKIISKQELEEILEYNYEGISV